MASQPQRAEEQGRPPIAGEAFLRALADHGVDDVHIIIALGLHRRMHDWEIKRIGEYADGEEPVQPFLGRLL